MNGSSRILIGTRTSDQNQLYVCKTCHITALVTSAHPQDILYQLLTTSLEACANCFDRKLAQAAFERRFPRLVVPPSSESGSATIDDVVGEAWVCLYHLAIADSWM